MSIEQKIQGIIVRGSGGLLDFGSLTKAIAQALLTSPDIVVVEKDKLQKMQRVVEAMCAIHYNQYHKKEGCVVCEYETFIDLERRAKEGR